MHGVACRRIAFSFGRHRLHGVFSSRKLHDAAATSQSAEHAVIVTKKKFSELPKRRPVVDEAISACEKAEPGFTSSTGLEGYALETLEDDCKETEKRKRRKVSPPQSLSAAAVTSEASSLVKPRRRRKTPVIVAKLEETLVDISHVPNNVLAKKSRRSRKAGLVPDETPVQIYKRTAKAKSNVTNNNPSDVLSSQNTPCSSKGPRNMLATEILANLAKFPHCILLTRVGQFYESYFDQAIEVSRLLNIKLTSRVWDKQNIAMCGFPLVHLDKHLKVLVQQQQRFVAMCEEFPRTYVFGQKPEFDRRVVRVITPGTLIDEPFLNQYENNYLLSISTSQSLEGGTDTGSVGLAWIDVSTGEFFAKTTTLEELRDDVTRISPREIVLDNRLEDQALHPVRQVLVDEGNFVSYVTPSRSSIPETSSDTISFTDDLTSHDIASPPAFPVYTPQETSAINILVSFMHTNMLEHMPPLSMPNREGTSGRMQIDSHTTKALEIRESTREGGTTGSLLSVIKKTVTSSGTRLLTRWLCSPSTSVKEIQARQSLVAFFYKRTHLRDDILQYLHDAGDTSRIVQKFLLGRGDTSDLLAINRTISLWASIQERIELEKTMESIEKGAIHNEEWHSVEAVMSRLADLRGLSHRISMALKNVDASGVSVELSGEDEPSDAQSVESEHTQPKYDRSYKSTIKPEFSERLAALHSLLDDLLQQRENLEKELQDTYDAPSLTLRSSPGQGMHVHISRAKRDQLKLKASPLFILITENNTTSSFFHQPWSQLGSQLVETTVAIANAEKEAFCILRNEVKGFSVYLRRNARIMDELDVTIGFANLAAEMRFVRPLVKDNTTYEVTNGRHPTVELGLLTSGRVFTPNSVELKPGSRLHVITGPNMAGKSTFLRQTALISILAQTGSFVPADYAAIGIVDKLFSRVGAKDDLFRDRSTFMVEMLETAEILRRATPKSLVIMDEVGRGTTVKDGLAIAFATVHHLVSVNQCRALFATHFHELTDMLGYSDTRQCDTSIGEVGFFCTDVDETKDGRFAYSHRLRPGVNRDSHGLKVAQLAGMPEPVVLLAKKALSELKEQGIANPTQLALLGQSLTTNP